MVILTSGLVACAKVPHSEAGIEAFKKEDYKTAYEKLYPIAMKGDSDAEYAIGYMLYYGKIGRVDQTQGIQWIEKSALQNNVLAQQALGIIYTAQILSRKYK